MMMKNHNCETVGENHAPLTATRGEEFETRGVLLEEREFERLVQRAVEVLKVREQTAA